MSTAWMVRAGRAGYVIDEFYERGVIAIGWSQLVDLSAITEKKALRALIEREYPDWKPGQRVSSVTQVGAFLLDMKPGDPVVSYNTDTREYLVGEIHGDYEFNPQLVSDHPHTRKVAWAGKVNRDDLSTDARNTLGAIQTIFKIGQSVWQELDGLLKGAKPAAPVEEQTEEFERIREDVLAQGYEFTKDRVQKLAWDEMQDLIAGILRAMGYRTIVSGPGADRGKDIIASPDGLGLEQPRIRVEVKHRSKEPMGAPAVRSFIGALRQNDRGLYISTGGFTREAHYEAERATVPLTLLDLDALVALLLQHYENLDTETRALIPLVRVYWPTS